MPHKGIWFVPRVSSRISMYDGRAWKLLTRYAHAVHRMGAVNEYLLPYIERLDDRRTQLAREAKRLRRQARAG